MWGLGLCEQIARARVCVCVCVCVCARAPACARTCVGSNSINADYAKSLVYKSRQSGVGAERCGFCFLYKDIRMDLKTMTWAVDLEYDYRWAKRQKGVNSSPETVVCLETQNT